MKSSILSELEKDEDLLARYRKRIAVIESIERLKSKTSRLNLPRKTKLQRPESWELRNCYKALSANLNRQFPECAQKTESEKAVLEIIQRNTNLEFYTSFWIGNRNVDLFCPAIGALYPPTRKGIRVVKPPRMRGLVIEVDGGIHDTELKQKKDAHRDNFLNELAIGVTVIENSDVASSKNTWLNSRAYSATRLDHRAKQRLLRKVHATTLAYHADDDVMTELYGPGFLEAVALLQNKAGLR